MNMWGFTPDYMDFSARLFARFLAERGHELKSEFYIPTVVNEAIRCGAAKVKVLDTDASWFGVTYAADRPGVWRRYATWWMRANTPNNSGKSSPPQPVR